MNRDQSSRADSVLEQKVLDKYRAMGFEADLGKDINTPFDLGGYQPDIIATRGNEKLIIEVKGAQVVRSSVDRFLEVANLVKKNPPWRFIVVTENDLSEGTDREPESWEVIYSQYEAAKTLDNQVAKSLLLWAILEAALRRRCWQLSIPMERYDPRTLIDNLYSLGELSPESFRRINRVRNARNYLAHGYFNEDAVPVARELEAVISNIFSEWNELPES